MRRGHFFPEVPDLVGVGSLLRGEQRHGRLRARWSGGVPFAQREGVGSHPAEAIGVAGELGRELVDDQVRLRIRRARVSPAPRLDPLPQLAGTQRRACPLQHVLGGFVQGQPHEVARGPDFGLGRQFINQEKPAGALGRPQIGGENLGGLGGPIGVGRRLNRLAEQGLELLLYILQLNFLTLVVRLV